MQTMEEQQVSGDRGCGEGGAPKEARQGGPATGRDRRSRDLGQREDADTSVSFFRFNEYVFTCIPFNNSPF